MRNWDIKKQSRDISKNNKWIIANSQLNCSKLLIDKRGEGVGAGHKKERRAREREKSRIVSKQVYIKEEIRQSYISNKSPNVQHDKAAARQ